MPKGPKRKPPAPRSSNAPNTLGESKRGTHSQSTVPSGATSAPVWQLERKAKLAIGVNGDRARALCAVAAPGRTARSGRPPSDGLLGPCLVFVALILRPFPVAGGRGASATFMRFVVTHFA